jgi:hypothetical protein
MSSTFTFGFSGDDIDADINDSNAEAIPVDNEMQIDSMQVVGSKGEREPELVPPTKHGLGDIVRQFFSSWLESDCLRKNDMLLEVVPFQSSKAGKIGNTRSKYHISLSSFLEY